MTLVAFCCINFGWKEKLELQLNNLENYFKLFKFYFQGTLGTFRGWNTPTCRLNTWPKTNHYRLLRSRVQRQTAKHLKKQNEAAKVEVAWGGRGTSSTTCGWTWSVPPRSYLDDGLDEVHPSTQQAMQVVPLLLQGSQVCLQLVLGSLVSHWEELPADVQRVDECGLIPLEQELRVLRNQVDKGRDGGEALWLWPPLLPFIHLNLIFSCRHHQRVLMKNQNDNSPPVLWRKYNQLALFYLNSARATVSFV